MLSLAQRSQDSSLLLWAYRVLGEVSFCLGEFPAAKTYSEDSVTRYDPQQRRAQTFVYGEDPAMAVLPFYSWELFMLGYPDRALQKIREALTLARELAYSNSLAFASFATAWVHAYRREPDEAREHAEAVISLTTEQGIPFFLALATIVRGWALGAQGDGEAGIAEIRQGLAAQRATGSAECHTYWLALLAEAYGKTGQIEEGLTVLTEALDTVGRTGERFCEAELYRLKGQLTLEARGWRLETSLPSLQASSLKPQVSPAVEREAEGYFLKAIEVAQRQQAKSWELRTATSLARLWQQQGKRTEAHRLLSDVYHWFTEGFDTKDLQEAKALIEELSQ
jgi:adenylate cyclase